MELSTAAPKPLRPSVLILACGNPSRGDDALGPLCLDRLDTMRAQFGQSDLELLTDFQLQLEHALDLQGRALVLFIDASTVCPLPYQLTRLQPICDASYTSHALSPAAVLHVYAQVHQTPPPPAFQLAIRGECFELGEPLSAAAEANLAVALQFITHQLLIQRDAAAWAELAA